MDRLVDEMSEAYKNLVAAAAAVIEARVAADAGGGEVPRTAAYDAALEELKERRELFGASCDRAEGAIDEAKMGAECGLFFPDAAAAAAAMEEEGKGSAGMGDGVGEVDVPIAARENAVGDDLDLHELMEIVNAAIENAVEDDLDLHDLMEIVDASIVVDAEVIEVAATEKKAEGAASAPGSEQ